MAAAAAPALAAATAATAPATGTLLHTATQVRWRPPHRCQRQQPASPAGNTPGLSVIPACCCVSCTACSRLQRHGHTFHIRASTACLKSSRIHCKSIGIFCRRVLRLDQMLQACKLAAQHTATCTTAAQWLHTSGVTRAPSPKQQKSRQVPAQNTRQCEALSTHDKRWQNAVPLSATGTDGAARNSLLSRLAAHTLLLAARGQQTNAGPSQCLPTQQQASAASSTAIICISFQRWQNAAHTIASRAAACRQCKSV